MVFRHLCCCETAEQFAELNAELDAEVNVVLYMWNSFERLLYMWNDYFRHCIARDGS
jgi:hypothetical protein